METDAKAIANLKIVLSLNREVQDQPAQKNMSLLQTISCRIHGGISEFFRREGAFIARRPWTVILCSVLVWLVFLIPLIDYQYPGKGPIPFKREMDKDKLYSPVSAPALKDRKYVEEAWGDDVLLTSIFLVSQDADKPNVLTKAHLLELMGLWEEIVDMQVEHEGKHYSWEDVCSRSKRLSDGSDLPCKAYSILDVWGLNRTRLEQDTDFLETITEDTVDTQSGGSLVAAALRGATTAFGSPIFRSLVLGSRGVETNSDGKVTKAEVFRVSLFKKTNKEEIRGKFYDPLENAWELALVDKILNDWHGPLLEAHVASFSQVDQMSEDSVAKESFWVTLSFGLVLLVSHVVLFRNNRAFCKTHLALISVIAISMAIAAAHGSVNMFGIPYNIVVRTVPFLLVGLGMDDTFVIMGAYTLIPHTTPIEERIGLTMQKAGSSILVTSVTDFVAFIVGTFAQIPAVQAFCLYAAVGVLFDFFFQVTFFVAFVALDARREQRVIMSGNKTPQAKKLAAPAVDRVMTLEPSLRNMPLTTLNEESPSGKADEAQAERVYPKLIGKGHYDPEAPTIGRRLFGEKLPKITLSTGGKISVGLIELALLGLAIYGCTKVYMDFRYLAWFTPKDSWLHESIQIEKEYFQGEQLGFSVYTKEPTDGRDYFYHQDELLELSNVIVNSPYISKDPVPVSSWYDNFILWSRATKLFQADVNGRAPNATVFNEWVKEFLDTKGQVFIDAIKFNEDQSKIVSTRFLAFTKSVGAMQVLLDEVDKIRKSVSAAAPSLDPFPYGFTFPFLDSFRMIERETIQNVIVAACAVFLICLIVLANFLTTVWVVLMVILTDVLLFGENNNIRVPACKGFCIYSNFLCLYLVFPFPIVATSFMHYANLQFNIVTSINIILAVGIAVDYSSHVAHSYLNASGTRQERAEKALYDIGGEVFSGALTTWVAVLGLGFASHYIFNVFFKMFFVVVVAGLWHGIIVLPVLLSVAGSKAGWGNQNTTKHADDANKM